MLGLGLFLFGLLYTHAASPDATVSHLASDAGVSVSGAHFEPTAEHGNVASATSARLADEQPEGHHDGHGQQHVGEDCALGQPPQGPDVAVPCLSPLSWENAEELVPGSVSTRQAATGDFAAPTTQPANSAVLRI
uniref:Secreted protein n=2 Tax=unclassified Streptomyces TaxID=2593676 RepID=V9Z689_9ACTN|nr:hypothetical protein [Streptomyces sp. FR1]AHE38881.1 Hypothetical protein pFRL3_104c [Streptomyces sp. FR1]AHE39363.1 Putative secreted protein [Streptomyces sp. F2]